MSIFMDDCENLGNLQYYESYVPELEKECNEKDAHIKKLEEYIEMMVENHYCLYGQYELAMQALFSISKNYPEVKFVMPDYILLLPRGNK